MIISCLIAVVSVEYYYFVEDNLRLDPVCLRLGRDRFIT